MRFKYIITCLLIHMGCVRHNCSAAPLPGHVPLTLQEWQQIESTLQNNESSLNTLPNLIITKDDATNNTYIHLKGRKGAYIGRGVKKHITKTILYSDKPELVARCEGDLTVLEEGKLLSLFKGTQGIVQLHSVIQTSPKTSELILEYFNYGTLKGIETGKVTIPDDSLPEIAKDLLMGLKAIHDKGFIHRDLHRGNVLLKKQDNKIRAAIVDFGQAIPIGSNPDGRAAIPDSTCPPEVLTTPRRNIDRKKSECYSMGVLFHTLVFKKIPTWVRVIEQSKLSRQSPKSKQAQAQQIQKLYEKTVRRYSRPKVHTKKQKIADLTLKMVNPNPHVRISVEAALREVLALCPGGS